MSRITGRLHILIAFVLAVAAVGVVTGPVDAAVTVRTYETDSVGQVPSGCSTPSGAASAVVSSTRGRASTRSLRVYDPSTTTITKIACPRPAQQGAELSFYAYPAVSARGDDPPEPPDVGSSAPHSPLVG
jgi:diaminopimelate epimerase